MEAPSISWLTLAIAVAALGSFVVAHRLWQLQERIEREASTVFLYVDFDWRKDGLISCKLNNLSSIPVVVTELAITATDTEANKSNSVRQHASWQLAASKPKHVIFTSSEVDALVQPFTLTQARFLQVDVAITYAARNRVTKEVIRVFEGNLGKDWSGRYIATGNEN